MFFSSQPIVRRREVILRKGQQCGHHPLRE